MILAFRHGLTPIIGEPIRPNVSLPLRIRTARIRTGCAVPLSSPLYLSRVTCVFLR